MDLLRFDSAKATKKVQFSGNDHLFGCQVSSLPHGVCAAPFLWDLEGDVV